MTYARNCELDAALGGLLCRHLVGNDFVQKVQRHIVGSIDVDGSCGEMHCIFGEFEFLVLALNDHCNE